MRVDMPVVDKGIAKCIQCGKEAPDYKPEYCCHAICELIEREGR